MINYVIFCQQSWCSSYFHPSVSIICRQFRCSRTQIVKPVLCPFENKVFKVLKMKKTVKSVETRKLENWKTCQNTLSNHAYKLNVCQTLYCDNSIGNKIIEAWMIDKRKFIEITAIKQKQGILQCITFLESLPFLFFKMSKSWEKCRKIME